MYKVFLGEKCIVITGSSSVGAHEKELSEGMSEAKVIPFRSSEELALEYNHFQHSSRLKKIIITGDTDEIWRSFRSLFTCLEAAGGAVVNPQGDLLMIFRNNYWDLPKGKIDAGEFVRQTALREVQEECGIKNLSIIEELSSTYHIHQRDKGDRLKRTYWFKMYCSDLQKPVPQLSENITQAKWVSKEEAKKILPLVYPSLREIIHSIFS